MNMTPVSEPSPPRPSKAPMYIAVGCAAAVVGVVVLAIAAAVVLPALAGSRRARVVRREVEEEKARTAASVAPTRVKTLIDRGNSRFMAGNRDDAIRDYTEAIGIDPDCAEAYAYRGRARYHNGDEQAFDDFDRAVALDPKNPLAFILRADARFDMGDLDRAEPDYAEALRVAPPNWPSRAEAQSALQRIRDARQNP